MTQHTPGPWRVFGAVGEQWINSDNDTIASLIGDEANARVIAAAPELLAKLQQVLHNGWLDAECEGVTEFANSIADILAKATEGQS